MSTPPQVDLPEGVVVERWPSRGGDRAVMRTRMEDTERWAVFVPGFTGSKEDFIAVLPLLAESGIGALSYDQFGQYESAASDDPSDYRIGALAQDLGALIDMAANRFGRDDAPHLVGHSFGGLVSQQALIARDASPASFVALCTGPGALPAERWGGLPDLVEALPDTDLDTIWSRMKQLDRSAGKPQPPADIDAFLRRRWLASSPVQLREFALMLMELPPMTEAIRAVVADGLQVTVMWGELDDAWPRWIQQQLAEDLGGHAVQIQGAGHSPNADSPDALVSHLLAAWHR